MTDSTETRPDSLARNFSAQLKGGFNLGGDLPTLSQIVEEKKHIIITQRHELHEIEAQLEATEEALAEANANSVTDKRQDRPDDRMGNDVLQQPPVSGAEIQTSEPPLTMSHPAASITPTASGRAANSFEIRQNTCVTIPDMPGQWQE